MAVAFVYMYKVEESRKNLIDLYNNLPGGVMVVESKNKPN
jgi:hypothetical protein